MTQRFSLHALFILVSLFSLSHVTVANYQADVTEPCCICYNDLDQPENPDTVSKLQCEHLYHTNCIKGWEKNQRAKSIPFTCPECVQPHTGPISRYVLTRCDLEKIALQRAEQNKEEKKEEHKQPSAPNVSVLEDAATQKAILESIKDEENRKNRVQEEQKQRVLAEKLLLEKAQQASLQANKQEKERLSKEEAARIAAAQKASLATLKTDDKARQHRVDQQREQDRLAVQKATENSEKTAQEEQEQRKRDAVAFGEALHQTVEAFLRALKRY